MPAILEACKRVNVKVGEDLKICCVDGPQGLPFAHVKQNEIEMADKIVCLLLAQIEKISTETDILVPAVLICEG